MKIQLQNQPTLMLTAMWVREFKIPPTDPRFLQLSERELLEQVFLIRALESIQSDYVREATNAPTPDPTSDPFSPAYKVKEKVVLGKDAEKLSDQPRLTGDPEWDAVELAETDGLREPISDKFLGGYLDANGEA